MENYRTLILRSSRNLGSTLLEKGLINQEQLDEASSKLLEVIKEGDLHRACLLKLLMYELNALQEDDLFSSSQYPLIALQQFNIPDCREYGVELDLCYATWTIPFDCLEDTYFVATAYNLSEPVIEHWEEALEGNIIWHTTNLLSINHGLQQINEVQKTNA